LLYSGTSRNLIGTKKVPLKATEL